MNSRSRAKIDVPGRARRKYRLILIAPWVLSALVLAPLACIRRSTEIELDLRVDRVSLVVGDLGEQGLLRGAVARRLVIQGYRPVALGSGAMEVATAYEHDTGVPIAWRRLAAGADLRIAPATGPSALVLEGVKINRLEVGPGSTLTFDWHRESRHVLDLHLEGPATHLEVASGEVLLLSCDNCRVEGSAVFDRFGSKVLRWHAGRPQVISIGARSKLMTLVVELSGARRVVEAGIPVREKVRFTRLNERWLESTVLSDDGRILFAETGEELEIREGDFVLLDRLEHFRLKSLELGDGLEVELHGRAGVLETGPARFTRNRLPSYLEWIYTRESWLLYLNALVLLATTTVSILKRLQLVAREA